MTTTERLDRWTCGACPHIRAAHLHYRSGTDCGSCACAQFRWLPLPHVLRHLLERNQRNG